MGEGAGKAEATRTIRMIPAHEHLKRGIPGLAVESKPTLGSRTADPGQSGVVYSEPR